MKMQRTYIALVYRSAGKKTVSAGVRLVSAGTRSIAVTLLIYLWILATYRLPLQNRPPSLRTLQS